MRTRIRDRARDPEIQRRGFTRGGLAVGALALGALILGYLLSRDRNPPVEAGGPPAVESEGTGEDPSIAIEGVEAERSPPEAPRIEPEADPRSPGMVRFEQRAELEVRVVDASVIPQLTPVGEVFVLVQSTFRGSTRGYRHSTTDAAGSAHFAEIPVGETYVEVAGELRRRITVEPGVQNLVVFHRSGGVEVQGTVVGVDGERIGGAEIRVAYRVNGGDSSLPLTRANDEGEFRVTGISPTLYLGAYHPDYISSELEEIPLAGDQVVSMELKLLAPGTPLVVHVQDAEGNPVEGAVVSAGTWNTVDRVRMRGNPPPLRSPASWWTDVEGRCELLGVARASRLPLTIRHHEFGTEHSNVDSEVDSEVRVTLRGLSRIAGRVLDLEGAPVPKARINCVPRPDGGRSRADQRSALSMAMTKSMDDGQFVIENAPAGTVGVLVYSDELGWLEEDVEVVPGSDLELVLRYPEALASDVHRLVGTIETPSGAPGANLQVYVGSTEPRLLIHTPTDANGRFEFARCPSWEVSVQVIDLRTQPRMPVMSLPRVVLGDSVEWTLEEELERGSLRIDLGGVSPGTALEVTLARFERPVKFDVVVSSKGDVLLENLVPGTYELGITGYDLAETAVVRSGDLGVVHVEIP